MMPGECSMLQPILRHALLLPRLMTQKTECITLKLGHSVLIFDMESKKCFQIKLNIKARVCREVFNVILYFLQGFLQKLQ